MERHARAFGYGELVLDHTFHSTPERMVYMRTDGGGSVWNLLANLRSWGRDVTALGCAGEDYFGEAARESLAALGVDVSATQVVAGSITRVVFETLKTCSHRSVRSTHSFGDLCLICAQRQPDRLLVRASLTQPTQFRWNARDVVCVDKLTKDRVAVAEAAKQSGLVTVLDCGRFAHLRWVPATRVLTWLRSFDVVLLPLTVANSLCRRAHCDSSPAGLFHQLRPGSLLIVSDGPAGAQFLLRHDRNSLSRHFLPGALNVVDDAGAGDALLATVVDDILTHGAIDSVTVDRVLERFPELLKRVLSSVGARGHLAPRQNNVWTRYAGQQAEELREMFSRATCPFCGVNPRSRPKTGDVAPKAKTTAGRNVAFVIDRSLWALEQAGPISACTSVLDTLGSGYVVGTGGSYSGARFVSLAINSYGKSLTQPIRPYDYIRVGRKTDFVIVLSYSGKTPDCREAVLHAKRLGVERILLFSSARDPVIAREFRPSDIVVTYGNGAKERGFVSIAGTVVPCVIWVAACLGPQTASAIESWRSRQWVTKEQSAMVAQHLRKYGAIDVVGTGFAWPAIVDIESKFTEGDVGRVTLHESKDFSHGRFMIAFGGRKASCFVVARLGAKQEYELALESTLRSAGDVVVLETANDGLLGGLELVVAAQRFSHSVAQLLGRDISKPTRIPPEGLALYRWSKPMMHDES